MTRFQQFLYERRLCEYAQYLNTLSANQLQEEISQLDAETIENLEHYLDEGVKEFMQGVKKRVMPYAAAGLVGAGALMGANAIKNKLTGGPEKTQGVKHVETENKPTQLGYKKDGSKFTTKDSGTIYNKHGKAYGSAGISSDVDDD